MHWAAGGRGVGLQNYPAVAAMSPERLCLYWFSLVKIEIFCEEAQSSDWSRGAWCMISDLFFLGKVVA